MRVLRQRKPDGKQRRWVVVEKLVELAEAGDVRSIELLVKVGGWRPESIRRHEHTLRQDLIVLPTGDKRGDPVLPPHQTDITPTLLRSSEGTEAGEAGAGGQEHGEGQAAGSDAPEQTPPA
jgi:hypothetical protein